MVTVKFKSEIRNSDDEVTHQIRIEKEERSMSVKFYIDKINEDRDAKQIFEFQIYWTSLFKFVKSCLGSHVKTF